MNSGRKPRRKRGVIDGKKISKYRMGAGSVTDQDRAYQHQLRIDELNRRAAERAHDRSSDTGTKMMEAATRDAQEAIRVTLIINGGAAVAMLALVGAIANKRGLTSSDLFSLTRCLYFFCGGIVCGGITSGLAYLANSLYAGNQHAQDRTWEHPYVIENERSKRFFAWGWWLNIVALALATLALILFVIGIILAGKAIHHLSLV